MNSQVLSFQQFPLSVPAPAQNSSTSLCSWLQQSHLPLAQTWQPTCLLHHTQRKQPPNPPGDTSAREKNAPGRERYSQRKIKPNTATEAKREDLLQLQQCLCFTFSHDPSQLSLEAVSCAALSQPLTELYLKTFQSHRGSPWHWKITLPENGRFLFQAVNILWAASLRSHTMIYRLWAMTIKHSIKNQYQPALQTALLRKILPCGMTNPESFGVKDSTGFAINLSPIFCPTLVRCRGRISPTLARKG